MVTPWSTAVQTAASHFPLRRTPLDLFLALFLLTAAVGVWAAYDREGAWLKFGMIVGSVLLYYLLAAQSPGKLWPVTALVGLMGAGIAGHFLLTHDWSASPTDIGRIDRAGLWWMAIRPSLSYSSLHPNIAGGVVAALIPFQAAVVLRAWQKRQTWLLWLMGLAGLISVTGLLLTSSRGAVLALMVASSLALLWAATRPAARLFNQPRQLIFALIFLLLALVTMTVVAAYPGGLLALTNRLPGPAHGTSRLELAGNALHLAADFPFTGGGLAAFGGLYSQYVLVIPFFFFSYSHNFYLDVLLEQGIVGLMALLGLILGTVWLLARRPQSARPVEQAGILRWAIGTSLLVICLHGFVDSALYANQALPLLFLWAGMATAVTHSTRRGNPDGRYRWTWLMGTAVLIVTLMLLLFFYRPLAAPPLAAQWHANLGAVEMARVELAGWPHDKWDEGHFASSLEGAEARFEQALALDNANRTAHHRLGLIAMMRRDYATAVGHLETAHHLNRKHRGVTKNLGYSYVWAGQLDQAALLLADLPEARQEMDVYTWWWAAQGRDDLSALAAQMISRLNGPRAH